MYYTRVCNFMMKITPKEVTPKKPRKPRGQTLEVDTLITGGKGSRSNRSRNGYGNNNNNNNNKNRGKKGKNNKGNKQNATRGCAEVSRCTVFPMAGQGKHNRGNASGGPDGVPLAYATAVMEENLRVARSNVDWLRTAASGINVKTLEKGRNNTGYCVPPGFLQDLNTVLEIEKSFHARINQIQTQVKEMSNALNIDAFTFRDSKNKLVEDHTLMTSLLIEGYLLFGGINLRDLLLLENDSFWKRVKKENSIEPDPLISGLSYASNDHIFYASFSTYDSGEFEIAFNIGIDGRAVQPRLDRDTTGSRDIYLLSKSDADEMFRHADLQEPLLSKSRLSISRSRKSVSRAY